jgi:hypothetical protein
MLIHCDQDCSYQKDGYCTIEVLANYQPNGCVRCIQAISRTDLESGNAAIPAVEPQKPVVHF